MNASRKFALMLALATLAIMLTVLVISASGCGDSGGVTSEKYAQVEKGMTFNQVDALLGTPPRTHRTGPTSNPTIIWYYEKTEGEGLLRITFENAKVTNISPYDTSINPEE